MKSIAMRRPNNSPARRVNLFIMEQTPNIASRNSNIAVQTHTLHINVIKADSKSKKSYPRIFFPEKG